MAHPVCYVFKLLREEQKKDGGLSFLPKASCRNDLSYRTVLDICHQFSILIFCQAENDVVTILLCKIRPIGGSITVRVFVQLVENSLKLGLISSTAKQATTEN